MLYTIGMVVLIASRVPLGAYGNINIRICCQPVNHKSTVLLYIYMYVHTYVDIHIRINTYSYILGYIHTVHTQNQMKSERKRYTCFNMYM